MNKEKHLAVIFSDWHIHDYKRFNTDGSRLENCLRVLFDIGEFCEKNGITTVMFAGDLYDTQKALLTNVVNETVDAFLKFSKQFPSITIYAITGNHDQSTKNILGKEAVSALKHIEAIVPDTFVVIDDHTVDIGDGISITGIPYYEYKEHFATRLSEAASREFVTDKNYLMIHQTPAGLDNDMIPADTNPKDEGYDGFDFVFCGHIHTRKQITENFTLVGNPIHRDLADAGKPKGFLVMNLRKPEKGFKFIQLKGYPEFISVFEDEEVEDEDQNYVVRKPRLDNLKLQESAKVEEFNTDLTSEELMRNFWKEADGKDDDLLTIGLSFLR